MSSQHTNQSPVEAVDHRTREHGGSSAFPAILNEAQTAAFLGVSSRTLLKLRREPWFPAPLQLGPRATRWLRDELILALANHAPRGGIQVPPKQLQGRESQ
jgi:predicted DNA-binding transcriptional regulator AlpA